MTALMSNLGDNCPASSLRLSFLKWQCRARQIATREHDGRPNEAMTPTIYLPGSAEPLGQIITVLNKLPAYSVTPELRHMLAKTNDPAQIRSQAITFFSASYYQRAAEFSDILTATFQSDSAGAARLLEAGSVRLVFKAFAHVFDLTCIASELPGSSPLNAATLSHNALFNPNLAPSTRVIAFEPDWANSSSSQGPGPRENPARAGQDLRNAKKQGSQK